MQHRASRQGLCENNVQRGPMCLQQDSATLLQAQHQCSRPSAHADGTVQDGHTHALWKTITAASAAVGEARTLLSPR